MKNKMILLSITVLSIVVGCGNVENTMSIVDENLSSVETVNVGETLEIVESVESSAETSSSKYVTESSEGAFKPIPLDKINQEEEVVTEQSTEPAIVDSSVTLTNEYFTKDENGKISVSEDFYSSLQAYSFFEGATVTEVNKYLTENDYLLAPLDPRVNDTELFKEVIEMQGEGGAKLHPKEVVTETEKPVQQAPVQEPVQQEPVQQPVEQPAVQETTPQSSAESVVGPLDELLKSGNSGGIDTGNPDIYSGIDHGDYTSY